ncbi:MAG: PQQ-binding-like beta-propeller repeat protein [Thermoguttaceae bacterium]
MILLNLFLTGLLFFCGVAMLSAADVPQFGIDFSHNRISAETNLPDSFVPGTRNSTTDEITDASENVCWVARIGSRTYTPPVISDGCVLIGTNNAAQYDTEIEGDRGVLLCFDEKTGKFLWQYTAPKVTDVPFFDTADIGITSIPTVANGRVYFIDNRGTVVCLELKTGKSIWRFDLIEKIDVRQHDTNPSAMILHEGLLYIGTANGVGNDHITMAHPDAPSFVVLDSEDGSYLARDDFWLQTGIAHGQWASPALGEVIRKDGRREWTIFVGLGNGILKTFTPLDRDELRKKRDEKINNTSDNGENNENENGNEKIASDKTHEKWPNIYLIQSNWQFDSNGKESGEPIKPFKEGRGSDSYVVLSPPVFVDNVLYMLFCYDGFTGARPQKAFLTAIDPTLPNDVSPESRLLWKTPNFESGAFAPLAVSKGLIYLADRGGVLHCFETKNGNSLWTSALKGEHWGGPLVADDKIFLSTNRRMFYVLKEGRETEILAETELPDAAFAGPVAANQRLFVPLNGFLYSIAKPQK